MGDMLLAGLVNDELLVRRGRVLVCVVRVVLRDWSGEVRPPPYLRGSRRLVHG
jgi:hypothetical protein